MLLLKTCSMGCVSTAMSNTSQIWPEANEVSCKTTYWCRRRPSPSRRHQTTTVNSLLIWFHKCEYQQGVLWTQGACHLLSSVNVVHHTLRPVEVTVQSPDKPSLYWQLSQFCWSGVWQPSPVLLNFVWIITELCTGRCTQLSELIASVIRLLVITEPCSTTDPAEPPQFYYISYYVP
jgi:hypothetical protein